MTHAEQLEALHARLESPDIQDDKLFGTLVRAATELLGITDHDLAERFTMSRSTATRWRNGTAVPHPAMRRPVYKFLLKTVEFKIDQYKTKVKHVSGRWPCGCEDEVGKVEKVEFVDGDDGQEVMVFVSTPCFCQWFPIDQIVSVGESIKRNDSTPESKAFWASVERSAAEVAKWPDWKRGETARSKRKL